MSQEFSNNGSSVLASPFLIGDGALTVDIGANAFFPVIPGGDATQFMSLTIQDATGAYEIVYCTQTSGDVFTISTRGAEGTTPADWDTGDRVELRQTAGMLDRTVIHNLSGEVDKDVNFDADARVTNLPPSENDGEAWTHQQGQAASASLTALQNQVANFTTDIVTTSGTLPALTANFANDIALVNGTRVIVRAHVDQLDEENITFNPDGLGAKPVLAAFGRPLSNESFTLGQIVELIYSTEGAGYWQMINPQITASQPLLDAIYPIGAVYYTTGDTNPGDFLGNTWVRIASGRFIVGVGKGTDINAEERTYPAGNDSLGEYEHMLTVIETPPHTHQIYYDTENDVGGDFQGRSISNSAGAEGFVTSGESTGSGPDPINMTPPAYGLYVWTRTA